MSTKSDEFEKQVFRIYSILESDKDSVVTWNEKIPDPDNPSQGRQIDVTVRKENTFIIIECRIHKKPQDVKWIEELYGRKASFRADKIIGVSASGFTKGAILKAEALGIFLRELSSVTDEEVKTWAQKGTIIAGLYKYENIRCEFFVKTTGKQHPTKEEFREHIVKNKYIELAFLDIKKSLQENKFSSLEGREMQSEFEPQADVTLYKGAHVKEFYIRTKVSLSKSEYKVNSILTFQNIAKPHTDEAELHVEKFGVGYSEIIKKDTLVFPMVDFSGFELEENTQFNGRIIFGFGGGYQIKSFRYMNSNSLDAFTLKDIEIDIVFI